MMGNNNFHSAIIMKKDTCEYTVGIHDHRKKKYHLKNNMRAFLKISDKIVTPVEIDICENMRLNIMLRTYAKIFAKSAVFSMNVT